MTNEFFDRLRLPETVIQVGGLEAVDHAIAHDQPFDFESYANANPDRDLYFLAGVKPGVTARAGDHDMAIKNYLVFDFDIRSFEKKNNRQIDDAQLREIAERILQALDNHDLLKTYSHAVLSGNGLHVYFIGKAFQISDIFLFKSGMKQYIDHINEVSPMPADKACINPGRIIRIPGSVNQKNGFKTIFIRNEYKESPLTSGVIQLGQERIRLLEEEAKIAVKEKIEFTAPDSCNSVYEAINQIPIQDLACAEFGWEYKGRHFNSPGEMKEKACFVASDGNYILHGGTDHFSDQQAGYSPFQFIRTIKNLDNKNTFLWFENSFQDIKTLAEEKRKAFKQSFSEKNPKYKVKRDGFEWKFELHKLTITNQKNKKPVLITKFKPEYYWTIDQYQENIYKKAYSACGYKKRTEGRSKITEVLAEVNAKWKPPTQKDINDKQKKKLLTELNSSQCTTLKDVYEKIHEICRAPLDFVDIVLASIISAQIRIKPPIWIMVIGDPSSSKTEIVKLFTPLDDLYAVYLDTMSENAFASGYVPLNGEEPHDLLPALDGKCFIIKDYTTLFSLNEDTIKKILGDLTGIFDEDFSKFTATRGHKKYSSLFSQVGCVTPAVFNKHHNYMNQLGPRFLYYKIPQLTDEEEDLGMEIAWSDKNRKQKIEEAKMVASSYCTQLISKLPIELNAASADIRKKISTLAKFLARARGIIITKKRTFTDKTGKDSDAYEIIDKQTEQPWRALQQLTSLARMLAIVRGKKEIDDEEIRTISNVAINSMPVDRARVLNVFKSLPIFTIQELADALEISRGSAQKQLKELAGLKIVDVIKNHDPKTGTKKANQYIPMSIFEDILLDSAYSSGINNVDDGEEIDVNKIPF